MEKKQILLVEDDLPLRDLMALVLKRLLLCRVVAVDNGWEALNQYHETCPHLVVLDILLPHMNGLELLHEMRRGALAGQGAAVTPRPGILPPVLVISALGYWEVVNQALSAGASDFLVKPFDPEMFVQRVRRLLHTVPPPAQSELSDTGVSLSADWTIP